MDIRTPLFLYDIPPTGIDIQDLKNQLIVQCTITCPIALRPSIITESDVQASCIVVECDVGDVKHVTTQIFMGLLSPIKNKIWKSHPISRAKPMTLASGYSSFPTCTKVCKLAALTQQQALMSQQIRMAFTNVGTIDTPFSFNNEQLTLRTILYDRLKVQGTHTVHGIVATAPGRILVSMDKQTMAMTLQKLELLFSKLEQLEPLILQDITGYPDRPRRQNDPRIVHPQAQDYITQ